jgi:hypothetical protein
VVNNINKTNNHHSPKTVGHKKKPMTYGVGNQGSGLGQVQTCGRVKLVFGFYPFLIIGSLTAREINKQ